MLFRSQETTLVSKPKRCACSSPACGPLPVTIVPAIRTKRVNQINIGKIGFDIPTAGSLITPTISYRSEIAPEIKKIESSFVWLWMKANTDEEKHKVVEMFIKQTTTG